MRHLLLLLTLTLAFCWSTPGNTAEKPSEYKIKAAYLYNFAKFIRWPDSAFTDDKAPLVIGVFGKNPFNGNLAPLGTRSVGKHPIKIIEFKTLNEIGKCHLLFIGKSESHGLKTLLNTLKTRPIVTIGEHKAFSARGGVIQFISVRNRLRFVINLNTAKENEIQIDAQLLSLATEIIGDGG
ncbi:hypothetical protein HRM2_45180 [Desulforapulum autotrophicum HRM2]|uniref:YfiR family protein n=1 Tax=Desulforapulum autotrophicum (strain ATCC 43914 / DSM 3382 / VKM B-1955 / HRM2) TaxID=177437 RepID=C0QF73_DESAH|nr:YfiR family protein [Desulforapulum autotrophicum]ACN17574.1 hypothetical protein HRM2_45180 [Desulforapulum autotrophicum HRM2]